jgi:hypothetical protein
MNRMSFPNKFINQLCSYKTRPTSNKDLTQSFHICPSAVSPLGLPLKSIVDPCDGCGDAYGSNQDHEDDYDPKESIRNIWKRLYRIRLRPFKPLPKLLQLLKIVNENQLSGIFTWH